MAVYVTSDLHGYPIDRFLELLNSTGFCDDDMLYILGDVIDRGDDGTKYLEWLLTKDNVQLILGNHEALLLSCEFIFELVGENPELSLDNEKRDVLSCWMRNGAATTLVGLRQLMLDKPEKIVDMLDYLKDAPLYVPITVNGRDFLLVHGGLGEFREDKLFGEYKPFDLFWHRPKVLDRYFDDILTVVGHTPVGYYDSGRPNRMFVTETWIDIDTGAACGGAPMILRLDDMKEFYIQ